MATKLYVAKAMGWMTVVEASTAREALSLAKGLAASASLLRSDVTRVEPASDDDVAWFRSMGGAA